MIGERNIYIIGVSSCPVKIGVADDVEYRLSTLQVGCPDELVLHHAVPVAHRHALSIEAAVHVELKAQHRRGEWFDVESDVALLAVERIAARFDRPADPDEWIGDDVEKLIKRHRVSTMARDAIAYYRRLVEAPDRAGELANLNRAILSSSGAQGMAAFRASVLAKGSLALICLRKPSMKRRAELALEGAVRGLTEQYVWDKQNLLLDEILGKTA